MAKLNRRGFLAVAGMTGAAATLAACAGTSSTSSPTTSGATSSEGSTDGALTLTWWSNHPGGSKEVEEELISRFEAENPDITIQLVDGGRNYEELAQRFNAALSGSDLPDIIVLSDVWWFNFALNDQIVAIEDIESEAGVDTSTFVESLYEDYNHDGKHFAMPFARSTPLFYYNKEMWAAAGLPDRGPESWDEMDEWGQTLKGTLDSRTKAHGWGNAVDYLAWTFLGALWTKGGSYSDGWDLTLTSPETIAAVEWLKSTTDEANGYAVVSQAIETDFSAGLLASTVASTGSLKGVLEDSSFEVGTAFLPNPNGDGGCPTGGAGLAIPSGIDTERQVAAAKFIDFITNAENTAYWSQNVGYMPVRTTASDLPEQQAFLEENPDFKVAVDQLPTTRSQDYARVFIPGADQRLGGTFESILIQGADVNSELESLQSELQRIYDTDIAPKL